MILTILTSAAVSIVVCVVHTHFITKQIDSLLDDLRKTENDFMEKIKIIIYNNRDNK